MLAGSAARDIAAGVAATAAELVVFIGTLAPANIGLTVGGFEAGLSFCRWRRQIHTPRHAQSSAPTTTIAMTTGAVSPLSSPSEDEA